MKNRKKYSIIDQVANLKVNSTKILDGRNVFVKQSS